MAKKDPSFLFYSKDWIDGTAELLPEEKGVYIDLLAYQHQRGDLPNDHERLARLVRLSKEDFLKIWQSIKCKFVENGNRIYNQKLTEVMTERSDKSKVNKISGTFASFLRTKDLSKKQYGILKNDFKVADFTDTPSERLTERITEWCINRLKSIEDANEDVNVNEDEFVDIEYKEIYNRWMNYKKERKDTYKSKDSRQSFYKSLLKLSKNNPKIASAIIEQSIANNWSGIFELKSQIHIETSSKSKPIHEQMKEMGWGK